jgi:hypothetical protein
VLRGHGALGSFGQAGLESTGGNSTSLEKTDGSSSITLRPELLAVFRERASARATLVANGLMQSAVDAMQESAATQGLVERHGQDQIQRILADAFAGAR